MPTRHLAKAGSNIVLSDLTTRGADLGMDRATAESSFKSMRKELREWQHRFYAEGNHKFLIVLQALDAGGKDGTIRNVFQGVNPQGVQVTSFKAPTKEELAHDYLWRIHKAVPGKGMMGVFNRSHYEDVLIVRVQNFVPESVWQPRFEQINQFEKLLTDSGTTVLKFYLHISKDEQRKRLQDRVDDPTKWWKFESGDLKQREKWDDYQTAFEDVFRHTSTENAPWYVIPADQKWYRNWAIMDVIVNKMREIDPQYPESDEDLTGVVVE